MNNILTKNIDWDSDLDSMLAVNPSEQIQFESAVESAQNMIRARKEHANKALHKDNKLDPDTHIDQRRRDATKHRINDRRDMSERVPKMRVGEYFTVGYKDAQSVRNIIYRYCHSYAPDRDYKTELFRYNQTRYLKVMRVK